MKKNKKSLGFTLVELLVTISIIGILASIVYANFGGARASARDDIRKSALKEVQLSLELYKAQNGQYPAAGCGAGTSNYAGPSRTTGTACADYIAGLVPDFIAALPVDPSNETGDPGFSYRSNGTDYKLMSFNAVEVKTVTVNDEFFRCLSVAGCGGSAADQARTYAVYSAGAAAW